MTDTRESLGLPWSRYSDPCEPMAWISDSRKETVATAWMPALGPEAALLAKPDSPAAFIVTAANAHHDLVEALAQCQRTLAILIDPANKGSGIDDMAAWASCVATEARAREALAKAKGGAS